MFGKSRREQELEVNYALQTSRIGALRAAADAAQAVIRLAATRLRPSDGDEPRRLYAAMESAAEALSVASECVELTMLPELSESLKRAAAHAAVAVDRARDIADECEW